METKFNAEDRALPYIPTIYRYLFRDVLFPIFQGQKPLVNNFNWGGGRHCGKTFTAISFALLCHLARPDLNTGIYVIRKKIQNRLESYNTVLQTLPWWLDVVTNKNEKTVTRKNLHVEVIGLIEELQDRRVQKLGKTRRDHDVQFVIFDEAFEFVGSDESNIIAALGAGNVNVIFRLANPYAPSAPFFADFLEKVPFQLDRIKREGHYMELVAGTLYHWISPLAIWNENILNATTKAFLLDQPNRDMIRGNTVLYGKPTTLTGGIFSGSMRFLRKVQYGGLLPDEFAGGEVCGGLDIGYTTDKTALLIGAISQDETRVIVINEYIIDSRIRSFDTNRIAFEIMQFLKKTWNDYPWNQEITIYCDNDFALVEHLNRVVEQDKTELYFQDQKYVFGQLVYFERIDKKYQKQKLLERINGISRALNNDRLYVMNAPNLIQEMNLYEWDLTPKGVGKKIPVDRDNHSIDALSYLLRNRIYTIGSI